MSRDELLALIRELKSNDDPEDAHMLADRALLQFVNDKEVTQAFDALEKWYS